MISWYPSVCSRNSENILCKNLEPAEEEKCYLRKLSRGEHSLALARPKVGMWIGWVKK